MKLLFGRARDERGFTMITVMMVMLVAGLFVAGAYAASDGDLPLGGESRDSKAAYAAAEAGIQYYAYHVAQDPDYWAKCTTVPAPNPGEPNPVATQWYGTGTDTRTGHWRAVPGATSTYAVELLAAKDPTATASTPQCTVGDQTSMLDPSTGMFRIRSTGKAGNERRSIVASFRRPSFLDYLYFTDFETWDPSVYTSTTDQINAATQCDDYHGSRAGWCQEITFPGNDQILGPFHSNDFVHFGSGTDVGRPGKNDKLESAQNSPSYDGSPTLASTWKSGQLKLPVPTSNADLNAVATAALTFTGRTKLRVSGSTVSYVKRDGTTGSVSLAGTNGVIYVKNASATACAGAKSPQVTDYADLPNNSALSGCGNAYISGTYNTSFTLTTDNDIILDATGSDATDSDLKRDPTSDAVAGLVASNFVRVGHHVTRTATQLTNSPETNCTNVSPTVGDVTIDGAVLAVGHSFIVDNFGCGQPLGTVHIKGALAQKFRGRLAGTGTSSGGVTAGYLKDYQYDDRLRFRSPPYFLSPVVSAWHIVRQNEQVPAR
jgi:Tfp pilus assembly protein PilX